MQLLTDKRTCRFLVIFLALILYAWTVGAQEYRIMTYNIRYDSPADKLGLSWDNRKNALITLLNNYDADIIAIQEGLSHQVKFLDESLEQHQYVGVGRDDGQMEGEYCAIFYKPSKFTLHRTDYVWLSEEPNQPGSISWDAACTRMATMSTLVDQQGRKLMVINTHWDHVSEKARIKSAQMLMDIIDTIPETIPVFLVGDFNTTPEEKPYKIITRKMEHYNLMEYGINNNTYTYNAFSNKQPEVPKLIDHIFTRPSDPLQVSNYQIVEFKYRIWYPSDHHPVMATFKWN